MAQDNYVSPTIRASGTTFAQLKAGGLAAQIDRFISVNAAITVAATAPTINVTAGGSTGGLLEAGDYTCRFTEVNGFGETVAGTVSSSFTVSAGNIPRVTMPALSTGAGSRNLYLTPSGGTEVLYATGITTLTYDAAVALASAADPLRTPPATNTTAASNAQAYLGMIKDRDFQRLADAISGHVSNFCSGQPISLREAKLRHAKLSAVVKTLSTAMDEIGVLIAANHGTIGNATNAAGEKVNVRTFP